MSIEDKLEAAHRALHDIAKVLRERDANKELRIEAVQDYPLKWVKLDRYVELSGDTVDAVQSRRKAGKWLNSEQCKVVDGRLWINLPAVDAWIEAWEHSTSLAAAARRASSKR